MEPCVTARWVRRSLKSDCNFPLLREWLTAMGSSGAPHAVAENDVYEGYLIPKGSVVIANIW